MRKKKQLLRAISKFFYIMAILSTVTALSISLLTVPVYAQNEVTTTPEGEPSSEAPASSAVPSGEPSLPQPESESTNPPEPESTNPPELESTTPPEPPLSLAAPMMMRSSGFVEPTGVPEVIATNIPEYNNPICSKEHDNLDCQKFEEGDLTYIPASTGTPAMQYVPYSAITVTPEIIVIKAGSTQSVGGSPYTYFVPEGGECNASSNPKPGYCVEWGVDGIYFWTIAGKDISHVDFWTVKKTATPKPEVTPTPPGEPTPPVGDFTQTPTEVKNSPTPEFTATATQIRHSPTPTFTATATLIINSPTPTFTSTATATQNATATPTSTSTSTATVVTSLTPNTTPVPPGDGTVPPPPPPGDATPPPPPPPPPGPPPPAPPLPPDPQFDPPPVPQGGPPPGPIIPVTGNPQVQVGVGGPIIPVTGGQAPQVSLAKPIVKANTALIPVTGGVVMTPGIWQQMLFNLGFVFLGMAVFTQGLAKRQQEDDEA